MPNYRNKNRNRNKNKQRNKQQKQQQQQQQKAENTTAPTNNSQESPPTANPAASHNTANEVQQLNAIAVDLEHKNVAKIDVIANDTATAITASANVIDKVPDVNTNNASTTTTSDTVLHEPSVCENNSKSEINYAVNTQTDADDNMGNEKSKLCETNKDSKSSENQTSAIVTPPKSPLVGKVIVHRIICEDTNNDGNPTNKAKTTKTTKTTKENVLTTLKEKQTTASSEASRVVTHNIVTSSDAVEQNVNKCVSQEIIDENKTKKEPFKVLIDKILTTSEEELPSTETQQTLPGKVIIHKISKEAKVTVQPEVKKVEQQQSAVKNKNFNTSEEELPPTETQLTQSGKVTIHKISNAANEINKPEAEKVEQQRCAVKHKILNTSEEELTPILHKISKETNESAKPQAKQLEEQQSTAKVILHQVAVEETKPPQATESKPEQQQEPTAKIILHKVARASEDAGNDADDSSSQSDTTETATQHQVKVIVHQIHIEGKGEPPQEEALPIITSPIQREPIRHKAKPTTSDVRIVEISDESLSDLEELRSPVVSEAESSAEYCDEIQKVSDSITEISSTTSSSVTATGNQKQSRKQKRIALEHHFLPQMLNPRFLDSISEENSELSDNSDNPLSRSASTDSATTNCPTEAKVQKLNAKFPKSSLDFTKPHKQHHNIHNRKSKAIREEPVAMAVSARLQDAPDTEADESCTTLRTCMSPEAEAAEVVFINSASSSMSDLHDMELYDNVPLNVNNTLASDEYDLDKDLNELINKTMTDNICSSTLTSSSSSSSASLSKPTVLFNNAHSSTTTTSKTHNLTEFGKNKTINNSRYVNNISAPPLQARETKANTVTQNIDFRSSILSSSSSSSSSSSATTTTTIPTPANEHLVFAEIEEQISSVLSSINEVATQNTSQKTISAETETATATTATTSTTSSMKIHTNLSSTQKLPVTTTSIITATTTMPITAATATVSKLATRTLETSCELFNTDSSLCAGNNAKTTRLLLLSDNANNNMNTVRDLLNNNSNNNANNYSDNETVNLTLNGKHEIGSDTANGYVKQTNLSNSNTFIPIPPPRGSPLPPPIPPPPQEMHHNNYQTQATKQNPSKNPNECDNISSAFATTTTATASLPLLQQNLDYHNSHTQSTDNSLQPALGQLNNSITTLSSSSVKRQESLDSHCSDSTNISQCTAINTANDLLPSDDSDLAKTSSISDLKSNTTTPKTTTTTTVQWQQQQNDNSNNNNSSSEDPKKLRLLCAETVASLPYGDEVLEELATVAQNIGETRAVQAVKSQDSSNMPFPLPQLPHIDDLQLSLNVGKTNTQQQQQQQQHQQKSEQSWLGVQTSNDPKVLVCLSPSQRTYIQQKPEQKPDDLLDAHQKFVERRGYHEYTKEQLEFLEREKLAEQQLLQTAAMMKKLRKSITPPPPQIPPPPVPVKSSETATKAQNLSNRTLTHTQNSSDDANLSHDKEQMKASTNGENNGEENKHRLLSIIHDTSESNANNQTHSPATTASSHENNSRQTTTGHSVQQDVTATSTFNNNTSKNTHQFPQHFEHKASGSMQSVETALGHMFPTMGNTNIFDQQQKRFSNIESSTSNKEPFCSKLTDTQPKRYSSVETHYFESQKRCENGQVVQDFTTSKHETKTSGDKPDAVTNFPLKTSVSQESNNSFFRSGIEPEIHNKPKTAAQNNQNDQEIMSDLKLNKQSSSSDTAKTVESETTIKTTKTIEDTFQNKNANEDDDQHKSRETKQQYKDSYEEFRQRAKAAADAVATLPTLNLAAAAPLTTKVTSNGDNGDMISSTMSSATTTSSTTEQKKSTTFSRDHEKLFKEFDDLSKQLHKELETSKAAREQREKSASMFDLNRVHMRHKQQIEEYNKSRHEHLKELEQQIERSMRSRSLLFNRTPEPTTTYSNDTVDHQSGRIYEIPIHIENGYTTVPKPASAATAANDANAFEEAPPVPEPPKTYNIPIQMENSDNGGAYVDDSHFRRAESMFNLSDDMHHRQRTYSNQSQFLRTEDDWSKYASDLGSSENIARPFAKEVEICYQRRPGGIRAPRLTASTNDLSFNQQQSYDQYNAYNVRRHHAPMLTRAPEPVRPKFGSCYSMIERDPNPKYISTTTRRGVSPVPQQSGYFSLDGYHVREEDMRQRRASLPREIHEQQLKYITSKEEELRTEFERLQAERRRLMEEAQKAQAMQMQMSQTPTSPLTPPTRPLRDIYRSTQKLPTLTEDEVFRQQMAEEWLNKVAEREKRRLQNIIKISKIHEDEATAKHKADMEQEFLSRVKERRHKLAMPADSDWESGAESQPTSQAQHSEGEDVPPVKIIEGEKEANLRRLPRHLREFAKFSNHQKEKIEGGHREEHQEEERSEETTDNSMSRAVKKSSVIKTVKTIRAPMLPEATANGGQGHDDIHQLTNHKPTRVVHHQLPIRPRDPHLTDRGQQRKSAKHTRFAVNTNRRSWSESDLLQEIEKDLKLAKGFLFQNVYNVKHEYMSEPETENEHPKKMAQLGRRQYDGIGPMTNDGMPIILRSEVKEPHQHEWYKRLYQTIHKQKHGDECIIRYKQPRGRNLYNKPNGYQSEPEPNYDSDYSTIKYRTVNPNRLQSVSSAVNIRKSNDKLYGTLPNPVKSGQNSYKNQPGRIEDYVTGHSSVSEKEKKEWWDEIMDIFNVQLDQAKLSSNYTEGNLSRALAKESGYTSDSNLVFRKKEIPQSSPLSPIEQKQAYKNVQAGGEPPLFGFRKPAPEKSKVSPNRYYESDVNIHFKTPVRQEFKYPLSEEELAIRQAEQMQKLYQEERRRKYLQELQDMNSRRHTDNFTPSQKSPIPLNRYDDFPADLAPKTGLNQVKSVARALYNFQAQNSKELSFKKGDIIYIRRAIDKNWYEGEHNAMIGLFPANYVEIINKESVYPVQPQNNAYRKPSEGQARAKYNFQAQSAVELSLNKGELVALTRRVDDNWFEGRIANRKGIFPVSYVEVLTDIGAEDIAARTTTTQQARPTLDALRTNINNEFNTLTRNGNQPPNAILRETRNHKTDILHVDTSSEPLVYRALYKYRPQNSDELELQEGDIVHVLEKCDDGWYVGTSQRTSCFGTFPGNYVERV